MEKLGAHIPGRSVTTVTTVTEQDEDVEGKTASDTVTDVTDTANDAPGRLFSSVSSVVSGAGEVVVLTEEIEI
jgi:hypothetical protein